MEYVIVLEMYATAVGSIFIFCGRAARRVMLLACGFIGVPLGLTMHLNEYAAGPLLWLLSGTLTAVCAALDDNFHLLTDHSGSETHQ